MHITFSWEIIISLIVAFISIAATLYGVYYKYHQRPIWEKFDTILKNNTDLTAQMTVIGTRGIFIVEAMETMRIQAENASKETREGYEKINDKITVIFEEQRGLEHQIEGIRDHLDLSHPHPHKKTYKNTYEA